MNKKDNRQLTVAIAVVVLAVGAFLYYTQSDQIVTTLKDELPPAVEATPDTIAPIPQDDVQTDTTASVPQIETPEEPQAVESKPEEVDPLIEHQKQLLANYKAKVRLKVNLPEDVNFDEIDLDGRVAALTGSSPNREKMMAILATPSVPSIETIVNFINDEKNRLAVLDRKDFKISGKPKTFPGPENSGISQVVVIPGGVHRNEATYAAHIKRSDGKGSYLIIMKTQKDYFSKAGGDLERMMESLVAE